MASAVKEIEGSKRLGILCPVCGGDSRVVRTKQEIGKTIRYRKCLNIGCKHKGGYRFSSTEEY
jgi:hypothetical protein